MIPVKSVAEVFAAIQQAKGGATDFTTNFFPVEKRLEEWIARGELALAQQCGATFFFRKDRDFQHLYYCAPNAPALQQGAGELAALRTQKVVVDIVGKEAGLSGAIRLWEANGLRCYTKLFRMARMTASLAGVPAVNGQIGFAATAEVAVILQLLEQEFDCYGEQIPLAYELESAIAQRQILVARRAGELAGLLFFETQGVSSTLRFWTVAEKFRTYGFGSALMRQYFFTQTGVKRFGLWVAADNANAVQKYEHYGYKADGLVDYVLVNQLIRS